MQRAQSLCHRTKALGCVPLHPAHNGPMGASDPVKATLDSVLLECPLLSSIKITPEHTEKSVIIMLQDWRSETT